MSQFLFAYRAPKNYKAGSQDAMAAWNAWFESMGANLVDLGNPVVERSTLGNCATDSVLGGYSLITADDLEAAVSLARGCPFLAQGGGIEVGELALLNPGANRATTLADHTRNLRAHQPH
jgi:hypothetical protein